jgi:hypothetical protein
MERDIFSNLRQKQKFFRGFAALSKRLELPKRLLRFLHNELPRCARNDGRWNEIFFPTSVKSRNSLGALLRYQKGLSYQKGF